MTQELKRLRGEAWRIVNDGRASRIERLEALKIIAAANGILLPNISEEWLTVKQAVRLRQMQQELLTKALRLKERKRKQNRRAFLRRKLRALEGAPTQERNEQRS